MNKLKVFFFSIFLCLIFQSSFAKIFIHVTVDDQIITNYDILKESEYLKVLNPNLNQLNKEKISNIAKASLINEIIKKKEILKFIDFNQESPFIDDYLKNLYSKLNFKNENEFKTLLEKGDNYTLDEIKEKIKIELFWNELVYSKYKNQLKIDKKKLSESVEKIKNNVQKEFFLSEIVFVKKKELSLESLINNINTSINDIGFSNTANIFSISETAKLGGKIGWVNENSLTKSILEKLENLKEGEKTEVIKIKNNYIIIKIDKIRTNEIQIDKEKELEKLIQIETNKQLNQFSRIFFDKSKINYSINEK